MKANDYPLPKVEIHCSFCGRRGLYSKKRFVEIVGPETELPTALNIIAADCPEERASPDNFFGNCKPKYAQDWSAALKKPC